MHNAVQNMLKKYNCVSLDDYSHALKEILQQIALLGLWRAKFFEKSAFYGGTALRILYGLNRFSEDLDFSLFQSEPNFNLQQYNEAIIAEMQSFGFKVSIETKDNSINSVQNNESIENIKNNKNSKSNIRSVILKAPALQLIHIVAPATMVESIHKDQKLKIKMEVDIHPPLSFTTEDKYVLEPIPFSINTFSLPDLFATKIHAILCRSWKFRGVKGRDWFDLVWYVSQKIPLNPTHLKTRLVSSGDWKSDNAFTLNDAKKLLFQKLDSIDIEQARQDVLPFVQDKNCVSIWSKDFFQEIIHNISGKEHL